MQVTLNATAVLITIIICVTIYAICKMAQKDEKKKIENEAQEKGKRGNMHIVGKSKEGENGQ